MANALWITLIGMGLVFVAILLLWGGMALLVRVTAERESSAEVEELEARPQAEQPAVSNSQTELRRRAAAAAVSAALALYGTARPVDSHRQGGVLSAWQSVNRASQINQAVNLPRKKGNHLVLPNKVAR